jgi:hypothetical protein
MGSNPGGKDSTDEEKNDDEGSRFWNPSEELLEL